MNIDENILNWLLEGDPAIRYQVLRDLSDTEESVLKKEQDTIEQEGWGAKFLARAKENGGWGSAYYQPKWISTHYTLLDLKNMNINPNIPIIQKSIDHIFTLPIGIDGGINPGITVNYSDVCINGMILNFASYFKRAEGEISHIVDYLITTQMDDGGWNCEYCRKGARHSSLHTTINTLEGLIEYLKNGYSYRKNEIPGIMAKAHEFILAHRLFKSDKTGKVINKRMTMLSYPSRWKYDILRGMDYFQDAGVKYDSRMQDAIDIIISKKRKDGKWPVQAKHTGEVHFDMEKTGGPSRWNTLRVLRCLKHYDIQI